MLALGKNLFHTHPLKSVCCYFHSRLVMTTRSFSPRSKVKRIEFSSSLSSQLFTIGEIIVLIIKLSLMEGTVIVRKDSVPTPT